jgi:hypothetical protein
MDPIGIAGGLNVYGFAGGDPINFSDPLGLCVPWPQCAVAVARGWICGKNCRRCWNRWIQLDDLQQWVDGIRAGG